LSQDTNPFKPPDAEIEPVQSTSEHEGLHAEPRSLPAGQGVEWIREAWELFKVRPVIWILMVIVAGAIFMGLSLIPLLGFAASVMLPLLMGGWMLGCERIRNEGELQFEDLFAGFNKHLGPLAITGLIYLAATISATIVAIVVAGLLGGALFATQLNTGEVGMFLLVLLGFLMGLAMMVPVAMLIWFAPALVVFHDLPPTQAMKMSFIGCLRNIVPFLIYGLVAMGLVILGAIPFLLGWLVVYPILFCAAYTGYRDIFVEQA
jgi:hypothetical protein